ncbi:hypothetical protein Tco_0981353, partial [Tanacetum coccineum]
MDPNSSVGKTCLGENIIEISSDKAEGHGDWNSPKYQDTTNSGGKKETKAIVFHKMDTEEVSDRYVAPCFINGLEAYDNEINLGMEENIISNEFPVKLCLEHEVRHGNKVLKKELIVALRGEIYFVNFIINPKEDDIEPGVVLGRSFMCLTKGIADFENETIIIYPELDPFLDSDGEEERIDDDWDILLDDLDFGDIPDIEGVEVPPFVCKMGKSSRNKRKQLEKFQLIYSDMGPSLSTRKTLTQEEAKREALAISICERYSLLEEERPLDGEMKKDEEEAIIKIKGEALKEKEDPRAFVIPIRLEGEINLNALAYTGSDINVRPYRVYMELGHGELKYRIFIERYYIGENFGLLYVDWKPDYTRYFNKKEDGDGQCLHAEIRLTDLYGNIYDQGFVTKTTSRRLWEHMTMKLDPHDPNAPDNTRRWRK